MIIYTIAIDDAIFPVLSEYAHRLCVANWECLAIGI